MELNSPRPRSWQRPSAPAISFSDASSIVASQAAAILSEPLTEVQECELPEALGRVLARAVKADRDQPPFPRATRDGFAVRSEDLASSLPLQVVGQLRAGEPGAPDRPPLMAGEAVEIMTGAPLPPGADAVLMIEHVQDVSNQVIEGQLRSIVPVSGRRLSAGENVVPRGSEARQGGTLLEAGTRLQPEEIGLAASCGLRSVLVYPPPRVAILATGDELAEPSGSRTEQGAGTIPSHRIYDSNSYSLAALVRQVHATPLRQHAARDHREDLAERIRQSLKIAPLLLLAGGVSMGRYDLVEEVLASLGAEFFFTGVKMQPGKPVIFGRVPASDDWPSRFFFGLPGNPVSAMVTFRALVEPLLAAMAGEQHWQPRILLAMLGPELQCKPGLTRFPPAYLDTRQPVPVVTPVQSQGSGDLAANARANCYVIVPDDCEVLQARQPVRVLLR